MPKIGDTIPYNMEAAVEKLARKHRLHRENLGMSDAEYAAFVRIEKTKAKARKIAEANA